MSNKTTVKTASKHAVKVQKGKRKSYLDMCSAIEEAVAKDNN